MSSTRHLSNRSSSGTGSVRGSFFNPSSSRNIKKSSSRTSTIKGISGRKSTSNRSSGRTSVRRSSSKKNDMPHVFDFSPDNEAEIIELNSIVKKFNDAKLEGEIKKSMYDFDKKTMNEVKIQEERIKENTKLLLRQQQLKKLKNHYYNLYDEEKRIVDSINPTYFNNRKLREHEKLRNKYHAILFNLENELDVVDEKIRSRGINTSELMKDVAMLNKKMNELNDDPTNKNFKYYDPNFLKKKYNKSIRNRGGSSYTKKRRW